MGGSARSYGGIAHSFKDLKILSITPAKSVVPNSDGALDLARSQQVGTNAARR